jgi:hypothetical protein
MPTNDWTKNVIRFIPLSTGYFACFGDVRDSDLVTEANDLSSALALLAVRMSKDNWECSQEKIPFSQRGAFLKAGELVIEFHGEETGWAAEYWPEGNQYNSVGACHILFPEVAVATIALMVANPKRYDEDVK